MLWFQAKPIELRENTSLLFKATWFVVFCYGDASRLPHWRKKVGREIFGMDLEPSEDHEYYCQVFRIEAILK